MIPVLFVAALLLPALAPTPDASAEDAGGLPPDGCHARAGGFACEWQAAFRLGESSVLYWDLPSIGKSVATVTVSSAQQTDSTWYWVIRDESEGVNLAMRPFTDRSGVLPREDTSVVLLALNATHRNTFSIVQWGGTFGTFAGQVEPPSVRSVDYVVHIGLDDATGTLPAGGSAGSASDPHVKDAAGDATSDDLDILAVWFDQPYLDGGLATASIQLRGLPPDPPASGDYQGYCYRLDWSLLGQTYRMEWVYRSAPGSDAAPAWEKLGWVGGTGTGIGPGVYLPLVEDTANATLRTEFPVRFVGDPAPGDRFDNFTAWAWRAPPEPLGCTNGLPPVGADEGTAENSRPFALGGPEVWDRLRNGTGPTFAALAPASAPWYSAPLAADNLADTLQIAGAVVGMTLFLAGLLVVRRRRERLARLMDDIDAVLRVHADDSQAALAALDKLQAHYNALLREGRIDGAQHASLTARVEGAGFRLLRQAKQA